MVVTMNLIILNPVVLDTDVKQSPKQILVHSLAIRGILVDIQTPLKTLTLIPTLADQVR